MPRVFLTAEWRDLVMLNYEVDPHLLAQYVPFGTVLDSFMGKTYISLVGFRFCRAKLFGSVAIPFHSNFDEVNLRVYVCHREGGELRRGVAFIAEVVPKQLVAITARLMYGENYVCLPMRSGAHAKELGMKLTYEWKLSNKWCRVTAESSIPPKLPQEGSLEQFITEHYWGYSKRRTGVFQYHVAHVPWEVCASTSASFEGDTTALYGAPLSGILQGPPSSAFISNGSGVTIFSANILI